MLNRTRLLWVSSTFTYRPLGKKNESVGIIFLAEVKIDVEQEGELGQSCRCRSAGFGRRTGYFKLERKLSGGFGEPSAVLTLAAASCSSGGVVPGMDGHCLFKPGGLGAYVLPNAQIILGFE